jgi:mRNA interferase MazF
VVQNNLFNHSNLRTVVICALMTNLRRKEAPGNVLLLPGEGNLPEQSVVNVSQILIVDRRDLRDRLGALDRGRMDEVLRGLHLLLDPREVE